MIRRFLTVLSVACCLTFSFCSCDDTGDFPDDDKNTEKPAPGEGEDDQKDDEGTDEPLPEGERWFKTRGLVMGWTDVANSYVLDYIQIAEDNGLNTFSIYGADRTSAVWNNFASRCRDAGIDLEFEEHMMSFLLPRDLFSMHPEYFRMNENGVRVSDANGCPSSEGALEEVRKNAKVLAQNYAPTNNKYYFWLDDGGGVCHCERCKELNDADQALIFENVIIEAIKEINPDAQLAHLCYANTLDAPRKTVPHEDIFLEFAPFYRDWSQPLSSVWATGRTGISHSRYLRALKENLDVFPAKTAQVLEYWMDDSLFSGWDQSNLVEVPWDNSIFLDDLDTYASYGIRHIMCYCAYVGPQYVQKFGYPTFLEEYGQGLYNYEKK